ncbi:MAG: magnesium transporter, partial [Candidatus Aminicenantes bacterium]|nr:magnesium transporter [Candidatus Aminicenantes bacterium]
DLKIRLGDMFPKVVGLVVRPRRRGKPRLLAWPDVESLSGRTIVLKPGAETRLAPVASGQDEILLREELLDKQVVDTSGARIERVNDIHFLIVDEELLLVHVEIGIRGILRRMGWLRAIDALTNWLFAFRFQDKLVSWKTVQPLASDPLKKALKLDIRLKRLHALHPSELADILEDLDQESRTRIFKALDLQTAAETLQEVDPKLQLSLLESAPAEQASDILEEMDSDEATDLLADLPEEKQQRLIQTLEKPHRQIIEELLAFEEGTAGSIMTKDYVAVGADRTIGDLFDEIKKTSHPLESIAYLYVIDAEDKLVGVLTLRHLLLCARDAALAPLMNTHLVKARTDDDVDDVADLFRKYKFMALPVVDAENRLRGIITLRDIVESQEAI